MHCGTAGQWGVAAVRCVVACTLLDVAAARAEDVPASAVRFPPVEVSRPFFVRLGYGYASYQTSGRASILGTPVANARVAFGGESLGLIEGGWRFAPSWSVSVLSGLPPTASLYGRGAFAGYGLLRRVSYGAVVAGVQYHPFVLGRLNPYVGVGLNYTFIRSTHGGSMSELRVADSFGPVLQAGVEMRLTERLSLYADVRKVWLSFDAKGTVPSPVGPLPVRVRVEPDPLTASFGLSYRF